MAGGHFCGSLQFMSAIEVPESRRYTKHEKANRVLMFVVAALAMHTVRTDYMYIVQYTVVNFVNSEHS